jgi:hypothetical protein
MQNEMKRARDIPDFGMWISESKNGATRVLTAKINLSH